MTASNDVFIRAYSPARGTDESRGASPAGDARTLADREAGPAASRRQSARYDRRMNARMYLFALARGNAAENDRQA
jgi:hypothetical protein